MARNRRYNQTNSYTQKGRDIQNTIANRRLPLSDHYNEIRRIRDKHRGVTSKIVVEDRRTFHPLKQERNPRTYVGGYSRVVPKVSLGQPFEPPTHLSFFEPQKVLLCARRAIRRQVLHAKKIAGGTGIRTPRYNAWTTSSWKE